MSALRTFLQSLGETNILSLGKWAQSNLTAKTLKNIGSEMGNR